MHARGYFSKASCACTVISFIKSPFRCSEAACRRHRLQQKKTIVKLIMGATHFSSSMKDSGYYPDLDCGGRRKHTKAGEASKNFSGNIGGSGISPCLSVVENGGNSQFRNVNSLCILSMMGQSSYYHDKPPVCKPRSNTQRLFAWGRRLSHIGDRSSLRAPHGAILFFWQNKRHWYIDTSNTSIPCDRMSYHNRMLCRNEHNESGPQQCMSACSRRA